MSSDKADKKALSGLTIYLTGLGAVWLMLAAWRLAFFFLIKDSLGAAPDADVLKAFYIGLRFDGRLAAIITFPLGLALSVPRLARGLVWRGKAIFLFYLAVFFAVWSAYGMDIGFYTYLGERLNSTLFELMEDMRDGVAMIWESYPIILITLGLVAASVLSALVMRLIASRPVAGRKNKKSAAAAWLCGFIVFAWAAYGQVSSNLFPLRWSNAYFSTNKQVTSLALNPVQNLYDTYRATKDLGFDREKTRAAYPRMAAYLGVDTPNPEKLNFTRYCPGAPAQGTRPNVVIIIMESLGYPKSSFAPGKNDPTPFLRELAGESVFFPNFYANARTTARGVFSTMTGIPDVTQSSTGSRNPRVIDQRIIANEFNGYDKFYMLGGNANWANIRGIISNNVDGLKLLEESYWKAPNVDVWGISDMELLQESHQLFTTLTGRPFLAVIQTAAFHKPYTIPDDDHGFEKLPISDEDRANYGFISEDEYNSMRFADYSLRKFFEEARKSPYYANTVFLIFGDHGIKDDNLNMTAAYKAADIAPWHVPLIVHAPGRLAPGVESKAGSQVDVFPTAAGLAGIEYSNYTLGRDLFDRRYDKDRVAFISGKLDTDIRLIRDGWCFFDNRAGKQALYRLSDDKADDHQADNPEIFKEMRDLAEAFQESARYLLYNNKKQR